MTKRKTQAPVNLREEMSELYLVFDAAFPKYRNAHGNLNVVALAKALGVSYEGVYQWLRINRLPARRINKIVAVSKGNLTAEQLIKFVIN